MKTLYFIMCMYSLPNIHLFVTMAPLFFISWRDLGFVLPTYNSKDFWNGLDWILLMILFTHDSKKEMQKLNGVTACIAAVS